MPKFLLVTLVLALAVATGAQAQDARYPGPPPGAPPQDDNAHYGWADVLRVDPVYGVTQTTVPRQQCYDQQVVQRDPGNSTAGTILGAVVGGVLGSTIGKGDGRKAATVVGAVAGGVVGDQVGRRSDGGRDAWRIVVRLDDGRYATVTQREDPQVRNGDYVQVRDGHVYLR